MLPLLSSFNILKGSASMYEGSSLNFFRTTTGLQSGPDIFDELRFVMTFLTILGVKQILYSLKIVLEGKVGKGMLKSSRLEFLEKFLANNFILSDAEDNTFEPLNRGNSVHWGSNPPPPPFPRQKHHLASSCQAPLLNLQTVQAPFLVNPPSVLVFHELPKN